MSNILHILNGDSTLYGFNETGLEGEVLVWREVLSEGPLQEDILSGSFWNDRSRWITQAFNEPGDSYQHKVIDELGRLNSQYTEINLWFEFDLHCQVNLLGVLQMLSRQTDLSAPAVYLVCLAHCAQYNFAKGLGELEGTQLETLFDARETLGPLEFELAGEAWKLYVGNDAAELEKWLDQTTFWGALPLLKPALQAHLKRLSVNAGGLNYIEQKLLDIYNESNKSRVAIYKAFWHTEAIFGMGDSELDIYLNRLTSRKLIDLS